ncbi:MAG: hypothetical protein KJ823_04275 [Proteobacteria bacterium]|nr:hypothetical protein [Pseudomonadota bacterium]
MVFLERFSLVALFVLSLVWLGCAPAKIVEIPAGRNIQDRSPGSPYSLVEGDRHYHVDMSYDPQKGMLRIVFLNPDGEPVSLLREDRIRATLVGPDGKVHEFSFWYPHDPIWYVSSYRVVGNRKPAIDSYSVQEEWLQALSSFKVKVWIPLGNTTYAVNFVYP